MKQKSINIILSGLNENEYHPDSGGIQLSEISFLRSLDKKNNNRFQFSVYARGKTDMSFSERNGVKVHQLSQPNLPKYGGIIDSLPFSQKTTEALTNKIFLQNEYIHFTSIGPASVFYSDYIRYIKEVRKTPLKVFYTIYNYHYAVADSPQDIFKDYPEEWKFLHDSERKLILAFDKVFVPSKRYSELLTKKFDREILYLPNTIGDIGIYSKDTKLKGKDKEYKIFMSMCRFAKEKNIDSILTAFKKSSLLKLNPSLRLLLAGSGEELENYKKLLKEANIPYSIRTASQPVDAFIKGEILKSKVLFTGNVKDDEKKYVWSISDVFVLPSYREISPLVGLEALAYGIPIIGSNIPGWLDFCDFGADIINCNPKRVNEIEKSIAKYSLYSNEDFKKSEKTNKNVYLKNYSPDKIIKRRLEVYGK